MGVAVVVTRLDCSAAELRREASRCDDGRVACRILAIAHVLDGASRTAAAHVPRYLAEFEYRFNRRYDLAAMIPRLTSAGVRTPPMPYRLLKLAEDHA